MGMETKISWCDDTFNIVWGCTKYSPGCDNCYAESLAHRWGIEVWGKTAPRRTFGDKHWNELLKMDKRAAEEGKRRLVFCSSMCDVMEDHPIVAAERIKLYGYIEQTKCLDYLLLTKRAENYLKFIPEDWKRSPRSNVRFGVTAEDQKRAERNIPLLLQVPGFYHYVSIEPQIEEIKLKPEWLSGANKLDQVIVGGESGHKAREFQDQWTYNLLQQCRATGKKFFFKQRGQKLNPKDFGDFDTYPKELQVREFPTPIMEMGKEIVSLIYWAVNNYKSYAWEDPHEIVLSQQVHDMFYLTYKPFMRSHSPDVKGANILRYLDIPIRIDRDGDTSQIRVV